MKKFGLFFFSEIYSWVLFLLLVFCGVASFYYCIWCRRAWLQQVLKVLMMMCCLWVFCSSFLPAAAQRLEVWFCSGKLGRKEGKKYYGTCSSSSNRSRSWRMGCKRHFRPLIPLHILAQVRSTSLRTGQFLFAKIEWDCDEFCVLILDCFFVSFSLFGAPMGLLCLLACLQSNQARRCEVQGPLLWSLSQWLASDPQWLGGINLPHGSWVSSISPNLWDPEAWRRDGKSNLEQALPLLKLMSFWSTDGSFLCWSS